MDIESYPRSFPSAAPTRNGLGKNIALGCGLGCGGLVVLAVLLVVASQFFITPEMRAKWKKSADNDYAAAQRSNKAKADAFYESVNQLRRSLPAADAMSERRVARPCVPVAASFSGAPYLAVDEGWLAQFRDGFIPAKSKREPPWYRDQDFRNIEGWAVPDEGMTEPDYEPLLENMDEVKSAPYIAVFRPLSERWPVMSGDDKTFRGGWFRGWVILVDGKSWKPIGQAELSAASSSKIESFQFGRNGDMLLGDDVKTAMEKDFTNHFWSAADAAVSRICGRPENATFASHESYVATRGR